MQSSRRCNRAFELINDIFFGKCLGRSISPHFASCTHSLIHQMFALTWSSNCENKMTHYKKIAPSNLNWLEFWTFQGIWSHKTEKRSRIVKSNMENGKTLRLEELENRQQEMQEKISRATNMVTSLTKGKGITDDPSLQSEPMSWKYGIDLSIVPNPNDLC